MTLDNGAVMSAFNPALIAPYFLVREKFVGHGAVGVTQLVPSNVNRVAVIFSAVGGTAVVALSQQAAAAGGFNIIASSAPLMFSYSSHGGLVCQEFWVGPGTSGTVYVIEVLYNPES